MDRFRRYFIVIFHSARPVLVSDNARYCYRPVSRTGGRHDDRRPSRLMISAPPIRFTEYPLQILHVCSYDICTIVCARVMYNDHVSCVGSRRYRLVARGTAIVKTLLRSDRTGTIRNQSTRLIGNFVSFSYDLS